MPIQLYGLRVCKGPGTRTKPALALDGELRHKPGKPLDPKSRCAPFQS
jgi:hypothetical protein